MARARARVVILNGVGSVGKSATARALQAIATRPFLHVAMDAFLEMLPAAMLDHPDGLVFERAEHDGLPVIAIKGGPVLERAMLGMRHAIAALAAQGNDLIVDEVMLDAAPVRQYRDLLKDVDLRLVGLFAPLDVLEARERARGDRQIGLARWQHDRVHRGIVYDLEVDTAAMPPSACAELIRERFDL
ncbi:MAG: AAA family ATPase [Alphaproteobacteria bacterium]|nr:AAA family ATPase [Alphaproteobacteria bacterium]MCW5742849.1 AAA family ATPase [Alphaproteobacteria bacterium]